MRKHAGVVAGTVIAALGLLLVVASLGGFSLGLPAVEPASALGASWFMIAVVLLIVGAFVGLAARGLELVAEEHEPAQPAPATRPVRHLRLVR